MTFLASYLIVVFFSFLIGGYSIWVLNKKVTAYDWAVLGIISLIPCINAFFLLIVSVVLICDAVAAIIGRHLNKEDDL